VAEIAEIVEKERIFFDQSGGGVTFSGGEPLLQPEFLLALLTDLGRRSIHRTVDTSGFTSPDTLLAVAQHTDLFLYDLKHMDSDRHREWTGVPNERILDNLEVLAATGAHIIIRVPLIASVNDNDDNVARTAAFIAGLPGERKDVSILPYHNIMAGKHTRLGSMFDPLTIAEPEQQRLDFILALFADHGLRAQIGG